MAQRKKAQRKRAAKKKAARTKAAPKKAASKKKAAKKKSAKKRASKKSVARKSSGKKTTRRAAKSATKKAAGKKTAGKKAGAKKKSAARKRAAPARTASSSRSSAATSAAGPSSSRAPRASARDLTAPEARAYSGFQYELSPPPSESESAALSVGRALVSQHVAFVRERQRRAAQTRAAAEKWGSKLRTALGAQAWDALRGLSVERRDDNYGLGPLLGNPAGADALGQARRAFRTEAYAAFEQTGLDAAKLDALFDGMQRDARKLATGAETPEGLSFARAAGSPDGHATRAFDGSACDLSHVWILGGGEVKVEPRTELTSGHLGLSHQYLTTGDAADFEAFDLEVPCSLGFWLEPERSGPLELDIELEAHGVGGRVSAGRDAPWASYAASQTVDWTVEILASKKNGQAADVFESMRGPGWRRDFGATALDSGSGDGPVLQLSQTDELAAFGETLRLEVRTSKKMTAAASYYVQLTTRARHVALLHDVSLSAALDNCWTVSSIQHNLW